MLWVQVPLEAPILPLMQAEFDSRLVHHTGYAGAQIAKNGFAQTIQRNTGKWLQIFYGTFITRT